MYERFTDRARKVMQYANQEAQRMNHEYIGGEHLLIALVKEGSGVAANALAALGVNVGTARRAVEEFMKPGPDMVTMGKLPQTPACKRSIERAMNEAHQRGDGHVGTEHLLLGLLGETETPSTLALAKMGVTSQAARQEVNRLLANPPSELKAMFASVIPSLELVLQKMRDTLAKL